MIISSNAMLLYASTKSTAKFTGLPRTSEYTCQVAAAQQRHMLTYHSAVDTAFEQVRQGETFDEWMLK